MPAKKKDTKAPEQDTTKAPEQDTTKAPEQDTTKAPEQDTLVEVTCKKTDSGRTWMHKGKIVKPGDKVQVHPHNIQRLKSQGHIE